MTDILLGFLEAIPFIIVYFVIVTLKHGNGK